MSKVVFVAPDGGQTVVEAKIGHSLMETAVRNNIPGIDGECGGVCACATCHVYLDDAWQNRVDPITPTERAMLDFASGVKDSSRLACQITLSGDLDGIVVHLPERQ